MDSRELVQIAKALTAYEDVSVSSVTVTVETDEGVKDYTVTSNGDLFRPFHVGDLGFEDVEQLLLFIKA